MSVLLNQFRFSSTLSKSQPASIKVGIGAFVKHPKTGKFLVGKRIEPGKVGLGEWQLPGGHLEFGESFEAGAMRETYEETGLRLKDVSLVTVVNSLLPRYQEHYVSILMKGTCVEQNPIPKVMEPHCCDGWWWVSWEELCAKSSIYRPLFTPLQLTLDRYPQSPLLYP
ncbi:hypothetical protein K493DRAFT_313033 [Basidiobolus meristosporus CBS 931.73]|uniref:Nudix hydrolase domain-containing protein n=1 Tax=Basidiobolus meristosporus CBS 931.73 TaxID=1314790 RepID=A0A1Y1YPD5_9FUNG|nr:hypothetical protein K493DRAFT_313033 [Basidiobolus meristosporus CBS 931.73]|eukprot:ORX99835.1 hypothetical protein K493DRAFT_313033 [Basidiobolus meristosporus CBS 931.73]